jgi:hypothetical protein
LNPASSISPIDNGRSCGVNDDVDTTVLLGQPRARPYCRS